MRQRGYTVTLSLPSVRGFEKIAMKVAEQIAAQLGFAPRRRARLNTVLAEACINAMEHGNHFQPEQWVTVVFQVDATKFEVLVADQGHSDPDAGPWPPVERESFDIEGKIWGPGAGRGWGLFLIRHLVDDFAIESQPGGGRQLRFLYHREPESAAVAAVKATKRA